MAKVYLVERKQDNKKFAAKIVSLTTDSEKSYVIDIFNSGYFYKLNKNIENFN